MGLSSGTAYVNGQRQGRILEKPFCIGDSIARERVTSETPPRSLPVLDVEAERKWALDERARQCSGVYSDERIGFREVMVFLFCCGFFLMTLYWESERKRVSIGVKASFFSWSWRRRDTTLAGTQDKPQGQALSIRDGYNQATCLRASRQCETKSSLPYRLGL
jgi:hypothetical protein